MTTFEYNNNGVCTNPKEVFRYEDKKCCFIIHISGHGNEWQFGCQMHTAYGGYSGSGWGCSKERNAPSEEKALAAGIGGTINQIMSWVKCEYLPNSVGQKILDKLKELASPQKKYVQAQLF